MLEKIILFSEKKISEVSTKKKRYLYDLVDEKEKIKGIVGVRGVGKTTLLLQKAKEKQKQSIYFSMDNFIIKGNSIFDLIEKFYNDYGYKHFFIDEIHKYQNWQQDLKSVYDLYDDIYVFFSGSSSIDLLKGNYDLSRRSILYKLEKFSFREYLYFKHNINLDTISFDEIIKNYKKISLHIYKNNPNIGELFKEYIHYGELPFALELSGENYQIKLGNILNKLIYEDISVFYNLKTENLGYFVLILKYIANSSPSKINYSTIAKHLGTTADTIKAYINILSEIGFVNAIGKSGKISIHLRKSKKIYFENQNFLQIFFNELDLQSLIGTIRESYISAELLKKGELYYPNKGDLAFVYKNIEYNFEIGGKSKTYKQLKGVNNAFLIKDDILIGVDKEIPIWMFGFLY